jgi:hypothetical protein
MPPDICLDFCPLGKTLIRSTWDHFLFFRCEELISIKAVTLTVWLSYRSDHILMFFVDWLAKRVLCLESLPAALDNRRFILEAFHLKLLSHERSMTLFYQVLNLHRALNVVYWYSLLNRDLVWVYEYISSFSELVTSPGVNIFIFEISSVITEAFSLSWASKRYIPERFVPLVTSLN